MSGAGRDLKDRRKRSVDHLQRLYAFVISLAVVEALRRTITNPATGAAFPGNAGEYANLWTLLATVVPFFHGANRYLDATYVSGEREAVRYALLFDFVLLFAEGVVLFVLSLLVNSNQYFYVGYAALLGVDVCWVLSTELTGKSAAGSGPVRAKLSQWAAINVVTIALVLVIFWSELRGTRFWVFDFAASYMLALLATVRTALDYYVLWDFYYPGGDA